MKGEIVELTSVHFYMALHLFLYVFFKRKYGEIGRRGCSGALFAENVACPTQKHFTTDG